MILRSLFFSALLAVTFAGNAQADDVVLFDVKARKAQLQTPEYASIKQYCMAQTVDQPSPTLPNPVKGLKKTEGYGSDKALSQYAWYLMVHSGRTLAGNKDSATRVKNGLLTWANASALYDTEEIHDAYYALKRGLLPMITSYLIVRDDMSSSEQKKIESWLHPLVLRVDKKFLGDVDDNNHRYLADSVLTLWGDTVNDKALYNKGKERFMIALDQMRENGSLPLETRRGARALWYIRQAIMNLSMIAEIYHLNNDEDLYNVTKDGKSLPLMVNYFLSAIHNPLNIHEYTAENYIPGPSDDFLNQDLEFLHTRAGRRHYMSFAHLYPQRYAKGNMARERLNILMQTTGFKELPIIDDFAGGNATCFWGQP